MSRVLELALVPDWSAVQAAWDPCLSHLTAQGLGPDDAHLLTMAAQELLENAVKYGGAGEAARMALSLEVSSGGVTIEVRSLAGEDGHLDRLDDTIQWIRGFQDPFEAYLERLKQVSAGPFRPGESGLGLTRVAYEAGCVLDFYVDAEGQLCISAIWRAPRALELASA
jgi:hypothetical protein